MSETLEYLQMFARFPFALRRFLKHKLTLEEARQIVRERMEHREENFLRVVEKSIYGYPRSPYLALLKMAGCEIGDLRALVKHKGLEGALRQLREEGVYVTFEEFKGRKPIERNGKTIPVSARDFDNPFARRDFVTETSGSTGLAVYVHQALDQIAAEAPYLVIAHAAHRSLGAPGAFWSAVLPGPGIRNLLLYLRSGEPLQHWFSPTSWRESKYWVKYGLAAWYLQAWIKALLPRAPMPEIVKLDRAMVIVQWIQKSLKAHSRCILQVAPSRAVRVCVAAQEAGIDLNGLVLRGGGEPCTPAKAEIIQRSGARYVPVYAMTEAGTIAQGCAQPINSEDVHLVKDIYALITYPFAVEGMGMTVPAFNLTTLLDTTPKLLLNLQLDDYGIVEERHCGCEYETLGFTTHLREIRSYSKLVSESATLIGNEMLSILEKILPARFGGSPLDYQLIEEEDDKGLTRLYLVVHPRVDISDEQAVIKVLLDALGKSSPMADAARSIWQQAQTIRIKRAAPAWTASGKMLPLRAKPKATSYRQK